MQQEANKTTPEAAIQTPTHHDDTFQTLIPTKNMPSLIGYYFALFGIIPFLGFAFSIVGVVLGVIGLKKFRQYPTPGAKGHALFAIIVGSFFLIIHLFFFVSALVSIINS